MVKTGYISFITETGGGQDADGNILPTSKVSSEFAQCNLMVVTKEYLLLENEQYRQAKYSCYIEQSKIPTGITLESVFEIQLRDNNGNDLGFHQVHNLEFLNLTGRIKLVV